MKIKVTVTDDLYEERPPKLSNAPCRHADMDQNDASVKTRSEAITADIAKFKL